MDGNGVTLEGRGERVLARMARVLASALPRRLNDDARAGKEEAHQRFLRAELERERRATERLRELDRLKDSVLVAVSHELRTPLTVISGVAAILDERRDQLSPELAAVLIQRLVEKTRKLERLLAGLLDMDRLQRGVIQPRREPVDVRDLMFRVIENMDVPLGDRPLHFDHQTVYATVDPGHLERIVENLIVNAVRHTPEGTQIWLSHARTPDGLLVAVDDSGPGVPDHLKERVFRPFEQGDARREHSPGLGVGLSLVTRLAQLHGGRAWVEDRPGGGASFRVLLPDGRAEESLLTG